MELRIRPSSLPSYGDCSRRSAAKLFYDLVMGMGFQLRPLPAHIGAASGTGTHAAVAYMLAEKQRTGSLGNQEEAEQRGLDALRIAIEEGQGVTWDDATPNMSTAQKQVIRQSRMYRNTLAQSINPVLVEQRLEVEIKPGLVMSGEMDCYDDQAIIHDLKTGTSQRMNAAQYGGYSLILRSHNYPVSSIQEDYLARVKLNEIQPQPIATVYPVAACEQIAFAVMKRIERDMTEFEETGSPFSFPANPMSRMCSDKFCPAHGTAFCPETLIKGKTK